MPRATGGNGDLPDSSMLNSHIMTPSVRTHRFRDMTGATPEDYEAVKDDMRRWLDSSEGIAACEAALRELREVRQMILEETGGKGIPCEDIEEALQCGRDH